MPIMHILCKIKGNRIDINSNTPTINYKVFQYNSSTLEMISIYKFFPWTKHIKVKLYYFRDHMTNSNIIIKAISLTNQLTDYLTKPLILDSLLSLRMKIID